MNIEVMKATALVKKERAMLVLSKHSPEILLAGGVMGMVGATVLACRATLKAQEVMKDVADAASVIDAAHALPESAGYTEEDYNRDRIVLITQTVVEMAKLYGPAVVLGAVSLGMLVGSNRILNKRNAAIAGAFAAVSEAYDAYRKRVREELGEEVDDYFRFRRKYDGEMKIVDAKAKASALRLDDMEVDLPGEIYDGDLGMPSQYAVFFDDQSPQWRQSNDLNEFFLRSQQNYANDLLNLRGHVFLNEVYDMLGLPRTSAGAVVGWVKNNDPEVIGDGFIDFDLYNPYNSTNREGFNNLKQSSLLLDFNVDGIIFELI